MPRVEINLPETFGFVTDIAVRISDLDYGGHLSNHSIMAIMHEARARFLSEHGFSEKHIGTASMVMVDAQLKFHSEGYYGDMLRVEVSLDEFSSSGCAFFFRVTNRETDQELARARTGMAFFDQTRHTRMAIPEIFRSRCRPPNAREVPDEEGPPFIAGAGLSKS